MVRLVDTIAGQVANLREFNPNHDTRGRFSSSGGVGGAVGVGPDGHSAALDAQLHAIEDRIRDKDGGETIYVLDKDGRVVVTNENVGNNGGPSRAVASVSIPAGDYEGTIVTHNHPAMGDTPDEMRKYDAFSPDDLHSAMGMNVAECRMVNSVQTQVIRPGPGGWGTHAQLDRVAQQLIRGTRPGMGTGKYLDGPKHYVLRQKLTADIADRMGWTYEVTPRG